jgi:hypothetical protein
MRRCAARASSVGGGAAWGDQRGGTVQAARRAALDLFNLFSHALSLPLRPRAQCLQYKTEQQSDLKKIERLNNLFFALTATGASEVPAGGDAEMAPADAPAAAPRQGRRKG